MSRLCPAADSAWSVGRSWGRARRRPRAATPAATAPEVTSTTRWPAAAQGDDLVAQLHDGGDVDDAVARR